MNERGSHCLFCRMDTSFRLLRVPLCTICRDKVYDFVWVTLVQLVVWLSGGIDGYTFVVEEVLLFIVLVIVKHRIPPPWEGSI